MTEDDVAVIVRAIAPVVRDCVAKAVAAAETRVAVLESQIKALGAIPERVVALETKAGAVVVPDLGPVAERLAAAETRLSAFRDLLEDVTELREKLIDIETRTPTKALWDELSTARLQTLEHQAKQEHVLAKEISELRERLGIVDEKVKGGAPDLAPIMERIHAIEMDGSKRAADLMNLSMKAQSFELPDLTEFERGLRVVNGRVDAVEAKTATPGPAGRDGEAGKDGKDGAPGKDGVDGVGYDDLLVEQADDRSFTIKAARGERVKVIGTARFPVQIQRGVYVEGKEYEPGDVSTYGGAQWHCNEPTKTKPGESKAWTLIVKRGRDGRDGQDAPGALPVVKVGGGR